MKNRISNLNDHLFAALERLNTEELTPEEIAAEATRAKAIVGVAEKVLETRRVALDAAKFMHEATGQVPDVSRDTLLLGSPPRDIPDAGAGGTGAGTGNGRQRGAH